MRALGIATVLLLVALSVAAAAPVVVPPRPETLVEGHTVFATIDLVRDGGDGPPPPPGEDEYAAAVAVLVREVGRRDAGDGPIIRFPGVLWFNDQYLVCPRSGLEADVVGRVGDCTAAGPAPEPEFRHPCTGAVLAINRDGSAGLPQDANGTNYPGEGVSYVESYHITDPNDHAWIVDRWNLSDGRPLWSVAMLGATAVSDLPDDGADCTPYQDGGCGGSASVPGMGCAPQVGPRMSGRGLPTGLNAKDPGDHGRGYPCGDATQPCAALEYNALLFFRLKDLVAAGDAKNHTEESLDWQGDVSGCHEPSGDWQCPEDDDTREGNSHPYNPDQPWRTYAGEANHGGSADCDGDGVGDQECHATRWIDIYYGRAPQPERRTFWIHDLEGSQAPFHCHADHVHCTPSAVG